MQWLNFLVSNVSRIYNRFCATFIIFSFIFRWRIHQILIFPQRNSSGMFMFWQFFSSWPLSCRGHSCRHPTTWLQKLASTYEVLYWWAKMFPWSAKNSLLIAPASYFLLSCSLSEDSDNNCLSEDMYCILYRKLEKVMSLVQPNRWQQFLLLKTETIMLTSRSLTLTLWV